MSACTPRNVHLILVLLLAAPAAVHPATLCDPGAGPRLPDPILFVAQVPIPRDFATIGSTFANHFSDVAQVGRGGDLYLRYPDGTLCNLTREAGFGNAGAFQGARSIAVRDPAVHWNGKKALFSMVVGAPTQRYKGTTEYWQIYEVTGLGRGEPVTVQRVPGQPADYNNVSPIYVPGGIVFTSDRPRNGRRHLYPQLDEYESTPTNTGLWRLDPNGHLRLLDHAPSGAFTPLLDSFGRVVYTRWDHLQRDQQADGDALGGYANGTFDYAHEGAGAARLDRREEVFPEPRPARADLLAPNVVGHRFNHFFPWQVNPDGTELETLNHVGRHELHDYFERSFNDDDALAEFLDVVSGRFNPRSIENLFQIAEDPSRRGLYYGVAAPEFGTHASGQLVRLVAPPRRPADRVRVGYVTHPATRLATADGAPPPAGHSGHYRDPLPLSDGGLVASHAAETRYARNEGSRRFPEPRHLFRLRRLVRSDGGYWEAGAALTPGIRRRVTYWDPDEEVTYDGLLWELSPVEVRRRPRPPVRRAPPLEPPEARVFADAGVDVDELRRELRRRGLALVVSRDVTTRDAADRQQPFNLQVAGGGARTMGGGGRLYEVAYLQFFQGDQIRGIGGIDSPRPGRRVLARPLHHPSADNPPAPGAPPGSVAIAADGSMAALVPARRALSWQLTDGDGEPVVRERYWVTFQPGEIRVCTSCHGLNRRDQAGRGRPANRPEALAVLLRHWRNVQDRP